ncbi:maleylacetoacetate isomerase [Neotabrizicola sp. VNH66]|uniref:maleylacetoacetate isomerase n=1 Tax=Neotabrizicola sp. VNH66 TaxID=3400918 RepID=UPI003C11C7C7
MTMRLHNFFRSSTSTRLRAALNLKGLATDYVSYALRKGETRAPGFLAMNPAGLVPVLELDDGTALVQSLAIMEWLDETQAGPPLLPKDAEGRARVRALSCMIACEIHPLNNLRVLNRLTEQFGADEDAQKLWFVHWVETTFDPLEIMLAEDSRTGAYCHGDTPGLADCCLYAQVWNNRRFAIDTSRWPTIARIFDALDALPAFRDAAPMNQPDAV